MSFRDGRFGDVKVPLAWTAAVAFLVALVVGITLLATDRRETFQAQAYGATREATDSILKPVGEVLSIPLRWIGGGVEGIKGYFFAVSENRKLKAELVEARRWEATAVALRNANRRYEALLKLKTDPPIPMVGARVVTEARGPFANTRLANAGTEAGVKIGNPVMSESGLVGRVIGVSKDASRILLLTDISSRVPVMIDRTNARAILTGDGGGSPRMDYLRGRDPVKVGDRVLTSGDGGVFPRGLPVGTAVKGVGGTWRVSLDSDRAPVDIVRILQFTDFAQLADQAALAASGLPPPPTAPVAPPPPSSAAATPAAPAAAPPAAGAPAPKAVTPAPKPAAPAAKPATASQ